MASPEHSPTIAPGGINELAVSIAGLAARSAIGSQLYDCRLETLQKVPYTIDTTDVMPPVWNPPEPIVPVPGDPGGYATSDVGLEDR